MTISDTLVDLRGHAAPDPAYGVYVSPGSGGNITTATADVDRLTIVGSSGTPSVGVVALADGAGKSATVRVRDSVISGIEIPVGRQADNGATASLTTSRSAYPNSAAPYDIGPGSLVEQNRLKVAPGFVGGFHLAADSPLIDAGTPGSVAADATDRDGRPRASDGNGDCAHVSDIGAFEYQGTAVRAAAAAAPAAATGQAVGFSAAGSCIPGPGAPAFHWRFDDGATASGASVAHGFATPGRHTATVTVSDGDGHSAQAAATVDVTAATAPPPTAATAPRISRLRVAPARVQIGAHLPRLVRTAGKRPLSTIGFRLSKRATVTLRVARLARGGRARPVNAALRIRARKGANRIRFAARLTRRVALAPGAYRLTAVATDGAGARSKRVSTRFTAVAPMPR